LGDGKVFQFINYPAIYPQRFSSGTSGGRNLKGNGQPRLAWKNVLKRNGGGVKTGVAV